mmetsp:Transcript_40308/g.96672  ORF Transcript_40308/g.96672 Transcript_40308/m.96672 type:complete len:222 (+) Transcript_40308:132-797(+)
MRSKNFSTLRHSIGSRAKHLRIFDPLLGVSPHNIENLSGLETLHAGSNSVANLVQELRRRNLQRSQSPDHVGSVLRAELRQGHQRTALDSLQQLHVREVQHGAGPGCVGQRLRCELRYFARSSIGHGFQQRVRDAHTQGCHGPEGVGEPLRVEIHGALSYQDLQRCPLLGRQDFRRRPARRAPLGCFRDTMDGCRNVHFVELIPVLVHESQDFARAAHSAN